ncbi:glucokinase regulatory protein isoform X3 [Monodelphis domestica]|uniref:glucokinase regulatory protein isoform X3 n=1 Tax=Monodelphis domestica TaxID=13616 RepID=UPI0024E19C81|nr:glucokinase regulatory protein isoform X3 [Monodelphis domestica]
MPGTKRFQHVIETPEPGKWELSEYEASLPITEKSNPLTKDLDKANAEQIVQLLGQCDAEIFQEEGSAMPAYQRLYSESILTTMVHVAEKVQEVLKDPEGGLVVLSGGGTSGRMAFLMSVSFNQLMKGLGQKPLYTYLIAGGDRSVVASREGTEDSALHGIEELKKVAAGKKRVIVIGISVGLSAPFVAGQMDFCMSNPDIFLPVLVGFNPINMARNDPIEDWNSTFREIAEKMQKLQEKQKAFVLNPAIGGPQFSFSQEDFLSSILPSLTEIDTVLFIFTLDDNLTEVETLVEQVKKKTPNIQALAHSTVGQYLPSPLKKLFPSIISITWPLLFFEYEGNFIQKFQRELSTKWVLNTVSTGAHVLRGKILYNHMLDLRLRNSKLFWRGLAMLQRFSGQPKAQCIKSLLKAIHFPQEVSEEIQAAPISYHIQVAHEKEQVIPTALLTLLFRCSIPEAKTHLTASPSVCETIKNILLRLGRKRSADSIDTLKMTIE